MSSTPISRRSLLTGFTGIALGSTLPRNLGETLSRDFALWGQATLIPAEKGFSAEWLAMLRKRGAPETWKGKDLTHIGMPVGGLCCGQVYLAGDGRLWHWDVFHQRPNGATSADHYANPMPAASPLDQGFGVRTGGKLTALNSEGVSDVEFEGRYPMGVVRYAMGDLHIELEAFSPFIPLNTEDSSLPLTVMRYTVRNSGATSIKGELVGWLNNPVGDFAGQRDRLEKRTRLHNTDALTAVEHFAIRKSTDVKTARPDVVFEDFERESYAPWTVTGDAFGAGPTDRKQIPERLQAARPHGQKFVDTHEARHGEDSGASDAYTGTLTSPEFTIDRTYINFLIGGGSHAGETCLNLLVDGKVVRTAVGRDTTTMRAEHFDVREFAGRKARLQVVDSFRGGWGHITLDYIVFSDTVWASPTEPEMIADFGSMVLGALAKGTAAGSEVSVPFSLKPGQSVTLPFFISWYFPNLTDAADNLGALQDFAKLKKHYARRFRSAMDVAGYFQRNASRLIGDTRTWTATWYDSTLPYWFLERTALTVGCLATATTYRFDNGRFYAWEGVYCCAGTCQHVWNYAQGTARLFPDLERNVREHTDFGLAWQPDGTLFYRGEYGQHMAHDGQAGTIIRTFREHTTSTDGSFLKRIWPRVKTSIQRLMKEDTNGDGILDTWQYNTLDAAWPGQISWISSMYLAALRCGAEMARDMGDDAFAKELEAMVAKGSKSISETLFDGEFFYMKRDPGHPEAIGYGRGCHIDQVFGDSLLHQVGLKPILDRGQVQTALKSLFKYNFAPDAGGYMKSMQAKIRGGRWYAMPGEGGLVMTSFPRGGEEESKGKGHDDWIVGYFNECMNGFEYQAAAHMIAEGMLDEGLAIVRSLHERYSPPKRNPYNEIECSDHYSRSMASFGAFLTMTGFSHHGPRGELTLMPKMATKFPVVTAEGWGTAVVEEDRAEIHVRHGKLELQKLTLPFAAKDVALGRTPVAFTMDDGAIAFERRTTISAGQSLTVKRHT